jgi:hypothetical protein
VQHGNRRQKQVLIPVRVGWLARSYYNHPFGQKLYGESVFAVPNLEADGGVGKRWDRRRIKDKSFQNVDSVDYVVLG